MQDVLQAMSGSNLPATVSVAVDFYPLSVLLGKGIILGVEADLVQRRDVNFSFFRFSIRVSCPSLFYIHETRANMME